MRRLNPDTLKESGSAELQERQARTGEIGDGLSVYCTPDPLTPDVVQVQHRSACLFRPYPACLTCPHRSFEIIFEEEDLNAWVLCPRWNRWEPSGAPDFYTPVLVSECRGKPYAFCGQCPSREELVLLRTDKQKAGWLERYKKLTKEE